MTNKKVRNLYWYNSPIWVTVIGCFLTFILSLSLFYITSNRISGVVTDTKVINKRLDKLERKEDDDNKFLSIKKGSIIHLLPCEINSECPLSEESLRQILVNNEIINDE